MSTFIWYDVIQGSEAWDNLRRGKITASIIGEAVSAGTGRLRMGSGLAKFLAARFADCYCPYDAGAFFGNFWTDRGVELEPQALEAFKQSVHRDTRTAGFCVPRHIPCCGASPDGLLYGEDGSVVAGLEIKCASPATHAMWAVELAAPAERIPYIRAVAGADTGGIAERAVRQREIIAALPLSGGGAAMVPASNFEAAAVKALVKRGVIEIEEQQAYKHALPEEHAIQVHSSMILTGIDTWHFWAWQPEHFLPLHCIVHRDSFTEQLEDSIIRLAAQYGNFTRQAQHLLIPTNESILPTT